MIRLAGWLAWLTLAGCSAYAPFEPPMPGELKPGPGILSGPSGEFVLLRRSADAPVAEPDAPEPPTERKLTDPPPP